MNSLTFDSLVTHATALPLNEQIRLEEFLRSRRIETWDHGTLKGVTMQLTAVIYPDDQTDLLVSECPELGVASQGETEEEALANLREATGIYLEAFPQTKLKTATIKRFGLAHA